MVIRQGDVCWADLPEPRGSAPGYRRPVVVVQGDSFNRSQIDTVVVVVLTSSVARASAPGNVLLKSKATGLPKESVANVSQLLTVDRSILEPRTGNLPPHQLQLILDGINLVLGR